MHADGHDEADGNFSRHCERSGVKKGLANECDNTKHGWVTTVNDASCASRRVTPLVGGCEVYKVSGDCSDPLSHTGT